jgi:uncharacterized phiE125 gp8 family phage protein
VTAPAAEPVTLAEAKAQCRIYHSDDDTLLGTLIAAARESIDGPTGWLGRCLVQQTWDMKLDDFPSSGCGIHIPLAPLSSVTSISYVDSNGDSQTLAPSSYQVVNGGARRSRIDEAYGTNWPATRDQADAVTVRLVLGYPPSEDSPPDYGANVPTPIMQAILIMVADMYENREEAVIGASVERLPTVERLLNPYRASWL